MKTLQSLVSQEYKKYTPLQEIGTCNDLIAGYYGNPLVFNAPVMTQVAFEAIRDKYNGLITAANRGDETKITARIGYQVSDVAPAFELFRGDVNFTAKGSKLTVELSGFHSTKSETTTNVVGEKMTIISEAGLSGSSSLTYDSKTTVKKSSFLIIAKQQGTTVKQDGSKFTMTVPPSDKPTEVVIQLNTSKKGVITGLTKKDELDVVISSLNSAGSSPASNKATVQVP